MNEIKIFNSNQFGEIRTINKNNEIWFVGKDVVSALGYSDLAHTILDHVDEDDRINSKTQGHFDPEFGQRGTWLINESGLYSLVLSSKLATAKEFKRWITSEVIPDIRKHGGYLTQNKIEEILLNPDTIIKLATELKAEREKRAQLENKIEQDRPKTIFADAVSVSKNSILVGELAKLLKQNGVNIGQNRLFQRLRDLGYLIKRKGTDYNMPTQKSMDLKLFEIKERSINHGDCTAIVKTPKVTGKGQIYFINLFLRETAV